MNVTVTFKQGPFADHPMKFRNVTSIKPSSDDKYVVLEFKPHNTPIDWRGSWHIVDKLEVT